MMIAWNIKCVCSHVRLICLLLFCVSFFSPFLFIQSRHIPFSRINRELPEPVLTVDMMPHFEDVAMIPNPGERAEAMRQLIDRLPTANRLLLQYMFKHMGHIIARVRNCSLLKPALCGM